MFEVVYRGGYNSGHNVRKYVYWHGKFRRKKYKKKTKKQVVVCNGEWYEMLSEDKTFGYELNESWWLG